MSCCLFRNEKLYRERERERERERVTLEKWISFPPSKTHPSRSVEVRLELLKDGVPDEVEASEEVAGQERLVELVQVVRQEVGQGADGLLRGEVLWGPGQVEDVLLDTRLQL